MEKCFISFFVSCIIIVVEHMKKNENENTPMTRSERRAKEEELTALENANEPKQEELLLVKEENSSITETNTEEIQVGEIEKKTTSSNIVDTLSQNENQNPFEDLLAEEKKSSFNPLTWVGIAIILCFAFFLYLVIISPYQEDILFLIDSGFLLLIVFLFSLSLLFREKGRKVLSLLNLFLILGYIGTNAYFIYQWEEKKVVETPQEKEETTVYQNTYLCEKEDEHISSLITTEKDNITSMIRKETFDSQELLEEAKEYFKETEGLTIEVEDKTLILTFDFQKLDLNEYKNMVRDYLESKRETTDFTYIVDDKLVYTTYLKEQLNGFTCKKEKS